MSLKVCIAANALGYPQGGGHLWTYLNWALGFRALGCEVIWLELINPSDSTERIAANVAAMKGRLARYGLADKLALASHCGAVVAEELRVGCLDLDAAAESDLLLNFCYGANPVIVNRFRTSALLDIDPGPLQLWISQRSIEVASHDHYLSIGETVGKPDARFPDCGLRWRYTPPCVALDWWPVRRASLDACFTTITHWTADEWIEGPEGWVANDKRTGFSDFLDLPLHSAHKFERALILGHDEQEERLALMHRGWHIQNAHEVAGSPWDYQHYIQRSLGEFSCAKPSYVRFQTAWVSDRTLCYLASGKPVVAQNTGPSEFLPDGAGLFRFRTIKEATNALSQVTADYETHARPARALAAEFFDARKVAAKLLEQTLT